MTTIHASLHVRNISKLHGSAKSVALGALNGSATDLARLCTPQFLKDLPDAEIQGILPVLYTHLDPALVPSLDMLENIITRSIHLPCLDNTVRALYALGEISERRESFPLDAARDIWRRVWKWIDFIHTYWDFLPGFPPEQGVTQIGNSMLLLQLMNHPPTQRAMFMTPGVRRMIAAAWRSMLNYHATRHTRASLPELAHLLLSLADGLKETKNFEEILDAFGGSHRNMADAFKYQLSLATAEAKSLGAIAVLHGVLVFLESTYHPYKEFTSTLLSCGIVPSLVAALDIDGHMPVSAGVPYTVDGFLGTVVKYIQTSPGYPWITQALKAGLLRYIILFSENEVKPSNDGKYPDLKALLTEFLPNGMVSYHVVTQMKKSLAEVSTLSRRDKFSRSALFEDWKVFEALVRDRVIVLDQWERVGRPSFVACDNMKCNQIDKKGKFRCCAGCRSANYCSAECQRSDWKAAHRTSCTSLYAERRYHQKAGLTPRERAFMRALVHADYLHQRFDIALSTVQFVQAWPGDPCFFFDYTGASGVQLKVLTRDSLDEDEVLAAEWARAARSRGRLAVHIMRIGVSDWHHQILFPLRATSSRLYDGLRRIAQMNTLGDSQVKALVGALLQTFEREAQEIH